MGNNNDSVLEMYLYETNTLLEQLDGIALAAEQQATLSQDSVNEIFRIMHTLKGSAAMMEFSPLMTIAHRIEDLFFVIRERTMDVIPEGDRPALFNLMFHSIDYFRSEVSKIEKDEPLSENIDTFLGEINTFLNKIQNDGSAPAETAAPAANSPAAPSGGGRFALRVFLDEGCGMENLRAFMVVSDVRECVADFPYFPEDLETNSGCSAEIAENGFVMLFQTEEERAMAIQVTTALGFVKGCESYEEIAAPQEQQAESALPQAGDSAEAAPVSAAEAAPAAAAPAQTGASQQHAKQSLISVNLSKLDQLMAIVGEIVITESMVTASPDIRGLKLDNFTKSARQLRKLTDELQDISMSLRMVPVSATFQKMKRVVRDMGQKLGKRVNLTIVGEDTEVDKTIVDSISDPIMHIVRNSMDHGIEENAQMRLDAGKKAEGEIVLSAQHTGSEVIIKIEDDGAGVELDKVLAKAKRQGLATAPDSEYSQKEILNFLMMPGFSTNVEVTEFSGRGVGMDVVKRNVEEVGGVVTITSERGKGMCTTLKIPLTMAIMDGMEVSVGKSIFTIPINNIRQSFKVDATEIIYDATHGEMVKRMDRFYPVVRLHDFYHLETEASHIEDGILVWVETSESSYCLYVDELIGEQQVVVKPLPSYLNGFSIKNAGIVGCTILGDGNISIILDVANLFSATQNGAGF